MGARVAIVLLGVLAAGLPASAKELQVRRPVAVTAVPRVVYRPVPARPAPQTFSMPLFPMAVAPLPAQTGAGAPAQEQGPRESCERHRRRAES